MSKKQMPLTLLEAIELQFPDSVPEYHVQIMRRFACYDMPERDAIKAVMAGYSSPSAAMADGVIRWREQKREI